MFRSVLVPLDGSPFAEHALPTATAIAKASRAKLQLVKVHEPPPPPLAADDAGLFLEADLQVRRDERVYLRQQASRARAEAGLRVVTEVLDDPVGEAIVEYAQRSGTDLIVMTTHGRGPLSRLWLGSVADQVIRRATVPVLLIRPREGAPDPVPEPGQHVLVPLDGSSLGEAALEPAAELAERLELALTLVQVVLPPPLIGDAMQVYPPPDADERIRLRVREAEDYLEDLADQLRDRGLVVETVAVVHRSVVDALLDLTRVGDFALVAISTQGHGGIQRFLLGGVADKLVRSAELPVLVVRPTGRTKTRRAPAVAGARSRITR
jgi:nucleotide-binding universal stress UspA family protein